MKREDIHIRDPFVFPYEGKYYLFGTGIPDNVNASENPQFWCYISEDLENWSEPVCCFDPPEDFWGTNDFWAPEVYHYNGKFYLLGSFISSERNRATQALVADRPEGPYREFGQPLTPEDWRCLDGTLYVENGKPYLVFCHEWIQIKDGEIAVVPLKEDLRTADGEPIVLFRASESGWSEEVGAPQWRGYVTDGPFLVKEDGVLTMFWSSFRGGQYAVGMLVSESGSVYGPWKHTEELLFEGNGGHGMLFTSFEGKRFFALHAPNNGPYERPHFYEVEWENNTYHLKE